MNNNPNNTNIGNTPEAQTVGDHPTTTESSDGPQTTSVDRNFNKQPAQGLASNNDLSYRQVNNPKKIMLIGLTIFGVIFISTASYFAYKSFLRKDSNGNMAAPTEDTEQSGEPVDGACDSSITYQTNNDGTIRAGSCAHGYIDVPADVVEDGKKECSLGVGNMICGNYTFKKGAFWSASIFTSDSSSENWVYENVLEGVYNNPLYKEGQIKKTGELTVDGFPAEHATYLNNLGQYEHWFVVNNPDNISLITIITDMGDPLVNKMISSYSYDQ